jgi:hypothetical protein
MQVTMRTRKRTDTTLTTRGDIVPVAGKAGTYTYTFCTDIVAIGTFKYFGAPGAPSPAACGVSTGAGEITNAAGNLGDIRDSILSALGLTSTTAAYVGKGIKVSAKGDEIYPPYNLTPNGKWGGRRHRIVLPRPDNTIAAAESFQWNGKAPFYVPFEEPCDVPEPIYHQIKDLKRVQVKTEPNGGDGELTTQFSQPSAPYSYLGVTPGTADLCGSMTEWYQLKGPRWFSARSERELELISARLEVEIVDRDGKRLKHEDMIARMLEFVYGSSSVTEDDVEEVAV